MTDEQKEILIKANIPESWWDNCYITEEKMIFTPLYDLETRVIMLKTGKEVYEGWLEQNKTTQ